MRLCVLLALAFGGGLLAGWAGAVGGWWPAQGAAGLGAEAEPGGDAAISPAPARTGAARAKPERGFWHRAAAGPGDGAPSVEELANLPYLQGHSAGTGAAWVTHLDADAAQAGVNLVLSGHEPAAELQDLRGTVLHRWALGCAEVWPGDEHALLEPPVHQTFWRRVLPYPNGDLLAIFEGIGMIKVDADSRLVWAFRDPRCRPHHDLVLDDEGRIYTLTRDVRLLDEARAGPPAHLLSSYLEDSVSVLSPDGELLRSVSLLECFANSRYADWLLRVPKFGDIFHSNSVEWLDGSMEGDHPAFARGNVLVSVPTIHAIAVVDLERAVVEWAMAGPWRYQHHPRLVAGGGVLVFDNQGENRGQGPQSRVIEIDPHSYAVRWQYSGDELAPFYSAILGACQRLANGNTLITESVTGRAFEVTMLGDIVWEYHNPHRAGAQGELVASLFEVLRYPRDWFAPEFSGRWRDH